MSLSDEFSAAEGMAANAFTGAVKVYRGLSHLQVVVLSCLLCGGTLLAGYLFWHHKIWTEGYEARSAEVKAELAVSAKRAADAEADLQSARVQAAADIAAARAARPVAAQSAQRIVNENPAFAGTVRPPELAAQRLRELQAVSRAATGR